MAILFDTTSFRASLSRERQIRLLDTLRAVRAATQVDVMTFACLMGMFVTAFRLEEVQSEVIQSETATAVVDLTGGEDSDGDHESEPDETEPSELDCAMEPQIAIPEVIEKHDIGLLEFSKDSGKAIVTDNLRTEIVQRGPMYFQNSEGPSLPAKNHSMSKSWFKRKLEDGCGGEVLRSWLVYSPSKRSAFCLCCLLFSWSDPQSSLEQENGFSHWKLPSQIPAHEKAKNHRGWTEHARS
ncbi:hypothetical protein lerEdw1_017068 [Lerista edwardsae]|nr:hypothetical protein lerEdw1_017068 [Lerista edwardsae]